MAIVLGIVCCLFAIGLGSQFWCLVKMPFRLRRLLLDEKQMRLILTAWGSDNLRRPVPGRENFPADIERIERNFHWLVRRQRNLYALVMVANAVIGYLVGLPVLAIALVLFFLAVFLDPGRAVWPDINYGYLFQVGGSLARWSAADPEECSWYCMVPRTDLEPLLKAVLRAIGVLLTPPGK
jgi:hypothetical protein